MGISGAGMARGSGKRTSITLMVLVFIVSVALPAPAAERQVFRTTLSAAAEVQDPPVISSGRATAKFRTNGSNVVWGLLFAKLTSDAVAAHVHCGIAGANGPVGVTIFSGSMGTRNSLTGTFNAPDADNGCGWASLSDVLAAMATGNAYVNLHTVNYPDGELRGQVAPA